MHAEIIAVGDELTGGQSLDTNSQWIAQRLEELGVSTLYHSTVGDQLTPCEEVFRRAIERADIVIITGGLGPTDDDLTREALARAAGCELSRDVEALEQIRGMFTRHGWPMAPRNERQAMIPTGGRAIRNPHGTAPGIELEIDRNGQPPCRVYALPGVPSEMIEMWTASVAPAIAGFLGSERRVIRRLRLNCFGAGESNIESMLPELIHRDHRPTVGITAGRATITLRIVADGATEEECRAAIEPVADLIRRRLGTLVFGEEDDQLQDAVVRLLRERGKTLATAECATAGQVAGGLASVDNSADFFCGGMVLNKLDESVEQAAIRCRDKFQADYGLAIGIPVSIEEEDGGEGARKQHVPIALASDDGVQLRHVPCGIHPSLRHIYLAKHALNFVRLALLS